MFSRPVFPLSVAQHALSVRSHPFRGRVSRVFSSSSVCLLRRHQGRSHSATQKQRDAEQSLSPELLESFGKEEEPEDFFSQVEQEESKETATPVLTYWQWLEDVAPRFRDPKPRNWLGGDVVSLPFVRMTRCSNQRHTAISLQSHLQASNSNIGCLAISYVPILHGRPQNEFCSRALSST